MERKDKILLVLGNGFDLDLGFKTSYYDFANTSGFWPKCTDSALWNFMNEQKEEQGRNWGGVEASLEDFVTHPVEDVMFERDVLAFRTIVEHLRLYLHRVLFGKPKQKDTIFKSKYSFNESLAYYVCDYLLRDKKVNEIITFNYTDVNDYLMQIAKEESLPFKKIPCTFLHRVDDTGLMVLGISGDAKICDRRYDFLKKSHQVIQQPILRKLIDADSIIFYGLSFSRPDHCYFKQFFQLISDYSSRLASKNIYIVSRDDNSYQDCIRGVEDMLRGDISQLYQLNNIIQVNTDKQHFSKGASDLLLHIQYR